MENKRLLKCYGVIKMTNKELFKQAVNEGFMIRMERDTAVIEKDIICSEGHYQKLSEIFGFEVKKPKIKRTTLRRAVAAILIAAALLLAGCAAYIYKEQIGSFLVIAYDTFFKGGFADENSDNIETIEEYYTLTYLPEGYSTIMNVENSTIVSREYKNNENNTIRFEQTTFDSSSYFFDAEHGETSKFIVNEIEVFKYITENTKIYIWNNEKYAFTLETGRNLSEEEIKDIIIGIVANSK